MKFGFIGCGQMATALSVGIARSIDECEFVIHDPSEVASVNMTEHLEQAGASAIKCQSNQQVIDQSDFVFIAVKPQSVSEAFAAVDASSVDAIFVSVVAGTRISELTTLLGSKKLVRTMPNTPCLIGKGAIGVSASSSVTDKEMDLIKSFLATVGIVVEVSEDLLDAVTGLSGSGPAYVFTFIEALIDAGVLAGLPRDSARELAVQTVIGAAELVQKSDSNPATLKDKVTSPGGTTIHGLEQLEQHGFRGSVLAAVKAATDRSIELGNPN